jgi:hypothetical protein
MRLNINITLCSILKALNSKRYWIKNTTYLKNDSPKTFSLKYVGFDSNRIIEAMVSSLKNGFKNGISIMVGLKYTLTAIAITKSDIKRTNHWLAMEKLI